MANAPLSLVLRHIRKLAGDGKATDRQLLQRFANQHEEAAFELLVEGAVGPVGLVATSTGEASLGRSHGSRPPFSEYSP